MHLIVTRPQAQAAGWVRELQALGLAASALPLIEITALDDPAPLRQAWRDLSQRTLVMFVSANAVEHFFAAAPPGRGWPAGVLAGSTGPGTSAALRSAGVPVPLLVEPAADAPKFDSEALWERLASRQWAGLSVLVVRGEDGRDWLAETLRERGCEASAALRVQSAAGARTRRWPTASLLLNSHRWPAGSASDCCSKACSAMVSAGGRRR